MFRLCREEIPAGDFGKFELIGKKICRFAALCGSSPQLFTLLVINGFCRSGADFSFFTLVFASIFPCFLRKLNN